MTAETIEIEPVPFAYPRCGPLLRKKDVANCIAAAGVPLDLARGRAQTYARKGLIFTRERGENGWDSRLYEFHDAATAVVLSALHDAGISDSDVTARAAEACYAWNLDAASRDAKYRRDGGHLPPHPITRAVVGTAFAGESWIFNLDVWRNAQTEDLLICADLLRWGDEYQPFPNPPEGYLPMCAVCGGPRRSRTPADGRSAACELFQLAGSAGQLPSEDRSVPIPLPCASDAQSRLAARDDQCRAVW